MRVPFILLTVLLIPGFCIATVEVAIKGHLKSKAHRNVNGKTIFVKGAISNGMGVTTTDKNGDFILGFDDRYERETPLLFYCVNENKDTVLLRRVSKLKSDSPEMDFWIK